MNRNIKIWDAFTFFNEVDILEIRLEYLHKIIDYCVIAQAYITHRGNPWVPLINRNHYLVKKYSSDIDFIFCFPELNANTDWGREKNQRIALDGPLTSAKKSDLIIISDVDEIPNIKSVMKAKEIRDLEPHSLKMRNSFFFANTVSQGYWKHAKITSGKYFSGAQHLRESVLLPQLDHHGLHLSSLGGKARWIKKIRATPHLEMQKNFIYEDALLEKSIEMNIYPSINGIKLWSGGKLKIERSDDTVALLRVVGELFPNFLHSNEVQTSYFTRINQIAEVWVTRNRNSGMYRTFKNMQKFSLSYLFLIMIYAIYFPIRLQSLIIRKAFIRSRIKKYLFL